MVHPPTSEAAPSDVGGWRRGVRRPAGRSIELRCLRPALRG